MTVKPIRRNLPGRPEEDHDTFQSGELMPCPTFEQGSDRIQTKSVHATDEVLLNSL